MKFLKLSQCINNKDKSINSIPLKILKLVKQPIFNNLSTIFNPSFQKHLTQQLHQGYSNFQKEFQT